MYKASLSQPDLSIDHGIYIQRGFAGTVPHLNIYRWCDDDDEGPHKLDPMGRKDDDDEVEDDDGLCGDSILIYTGERL